MAIAGRFTRAANTSLPPMANASGLPKNGLRSLGGVSDENELIVFYINQVGLIFL